jgi:type I restriction enzyme S subunit
MVSQFELASRGVGSIQRQLHRPSLRVLRVPVPPRSEQERIASQLTAETREIDAAVDSLREEIALLKEYRVRLISDVVTGKLDVRAEAANLSDVEPLELAAVLAGGTASTDEEEGADGDD